MYNVEKRTVAGEWLHGGWYVKKDSELDVASEEKMRVFNSLIRYEAPHPVDSVLAMIEGRVCGCR